jgi:hypothetical protein
MTMDHDSDERRGAGDGGSAIEGRARSAMPRELLASARSKVRAALWRRRAGARAERKRKAAQATVYVARDGRGRVTNAR